MNIKLLLCTLTASVIASATTISFDGEAAVAGLPGSVTGWGFNVVSDAYPLFTGSQFIPDANSVGIYQDYLASAFFFGLAGATVTNSFDASAQTGVGEFDVSNNATLGAILFGQLQLFWDEYSLSPNDPDFDPDADFLSSGNSALFEVSVTVGDQPTAIQAPEPATMAFVLAGLILLGWNRGVKVRKLLPLLVLLAGLEPGARAYQGPANPTTAETQAIRIIRNQETYSSPNNCHPDTDPTLLKDCCGAPGVAGCVTGLANEDVTNNASAGLCAIPHSNTPRIDLSGRVLCNPPKATCDSRIASSLATFSKAGPQNVTFYFTSDIHWFRSVNWLSQDLIHHVQTLNGFPNTYPWMTNPQVVGDAIASPAGLVVGGDFTDFGSAEALGAHRLLFEGLIDASLKFPVFLGMGNHDLTGSVNSFFDQLYGPQRNFEYLKNTMGCGTHFDTSSGNYSWDWGRLHLVMLNTWAGDRKVNVTGLGVGGLDWLIRDLADNVGATGRPVILFQHYGFDCFSYGDCGGSDDPNNGFWTPGNTSDFLKVIVPYNVVAMFVGHTHTPSINRLDNTYYSKVTNTTNFNDVHGNPRLFDIFTNGDGGENGHGDFIAVRFTDGGTPDSAPYLDVQSMHWENGSSVAALQPDAGPYFGGLVGCRKRLDSRFNNVTGLVTLQTGPSGAGFSRVVAITNRSGFKFLAPMAIRVESLGDPAGGYLAKPDFVDFCGLANPLTVANGSYVLLTDAQIAALNGNGTTFIVLPFKADSTKANLNVELVSITPLLGSAPSSFDLNVTTSDLTTNSFTIYGAANSTFSLTAPYTLTKDLDGNPIPQSWLSGVTATGATCNTIPSCTGQFDPSGRSVVSFTVDGKQLTSTNIASPNAIFTVFGDSGSNGLVATVPVNVHVKAGVTITVTALTPSPYDTTKGPAIFRAHFFASDGVSAPHSTDASLPGGRVFLSEATLDASGNVVSTTPLTYVTSLNKGDACQDLFHSLPNPPSGNLPGADEAVFGDVGDQGGQFGYCPSFAYPGTNPFPSNLMTFKLHHFVVQYEGDSNFAPASSGPFDYLVEIPLVTISSFAGDGQSALVGTPFAQPVKAKVLQAGNATQSGISVTFTAPASVPTGVFAGNTQSVTVLTDTSGIATAPTFNAGNSEGRYTLSAATQGFTTSFSLTNLPPAAPLLTATIAPKSGPTNGRIWPIKITNSQADAFAASISQISLTQVAGTPCNPLVQSALPIPLGDIVNTASALGPLTIDFGSCTGNANRFTIQIGVTASGNYQKTTTIGNQFP